MHYLILIEILIWSQYCLNSWPGNVNRAFSLTWPAAKQVTQFIATQERSHMWRVFSHRNGRDTNMTAVWLFMTNVTSCEKANITHDKFGIKNVNSSIWFVGFIFIYKKYFFYKHHELKCVGVCSSNSLTTRWGTRNLTYISPLFFLQLLLTQQLSQFKQLLYFYSTSPPSSSIVAFFNSQSWTCLG